MTTKIERLEEKLRNNISDCNCLTCYEKNPNWIVYLQVILEEEGVDVEKFCQFDKYHFKYEKGHLFSLGECVNLEKIISVLKKVLKD